MNTHMHARTQAHTHLPSYFDSKQNRLGDLQLLQHPMAFTISTGELVHLSPSVVSPQEYFTDGSGIVNKETDVVLVVDNDKFYCHRLILSLASPVFTRMFDGEFREHYDREIKLEGKKSKIILELLKYIYPQFQCSINNDNLDDFLLLADEYMIENLKELCQCCLRQQLQSFKYVSLLTKHRLKQVL
jgi:hypothetical protein